MIEPIYKEVIKDLLLERKKSKGIILTDDYYNDVLEITDKNFVIKKDKNIEVFCEEDPVKYEYLSSNFLILLSLTSHKINHWNIHGKSFLPFSIHNLFTKFKPKIMQLILH
ncbi:hypothetical protein BSU00_09915 [Tenacibaculum sp. SG-28]|nr:hypothetical protein BSU00_09915 [Tenacibaculum sp. SG-28]